MKQFALLVLAVIACLSLVLPAQACDPPAYIYAPQGIALLLDAGHLALNQAHVRGGAAQVQRIEVRQVQRRPLFDGAILEAVAQKLQNRQRIERVERVVVRERVRAVHH